MFNPVHEAMKAALEQAKKFAGATSPNPPVGAAAIDSAGHILAVEAHEKAGTAHAEFKVIEKCRAQGVLDRIHTLVVTLEPCNHHGKTPPCVEAIIAAKIKRVVFGAQDLNPKITGQGAKYLSGVGIEVSQIDGELRQECLDLTRSFTHWSKSGKPWVVVKTAIDIDGSMIPPLGAKTFTSPQSIRYGHALRKRSDAILTGVGTILADSPLYTVRQLEDHPHKTRHLVVMDRTNRTPQSWIDEATARGFDVVLESDLEMALAHLGERGCLEVLVEAGPTLSQAILTSDLWNEHVTIRKNETREDEIHHVYRNH